MSIFAPSSTNTTVTVCVCDFGPGTCRTTSAAGDSSHTQRPSTDTKQHS